MFELPDDADRPANPRHKPVTLAGLFWTQLAAVTLGVIIGGGVLLVGVRYYVHWSVADTIEKLEKERLRPTPPAGPVPAVRTTAK